MNTSSSPSTTTTTPLFTTLITSKAKELGIKQLDKDILTYLNNDIIQKLNHIISESKKHMRITKTKTLRASDISPIIQSFNLQTQCIYPLFPCDSDIINISSFNQSNLLPCPLETTTHFHWFTLDGKTPNISTNACTSDVIYPYTETQNNEYTQHGNSKVVPKLFNCISSELLNFIETFEKVFQKDLKESLLTKDVYPIQSAEMEINLIIIQTEIGIVQMFPYLISYLIDVIDNVKGNAFPKVEILVLTHIKSILMNKYFYIDPFISKIITLLLTLIIKDDNMYNSNHNYIIASIRAKNIERDCLEIIYNKYNNVYTNLTNDIVGLLKEYLLPNERMPMYLATYGAIRALNVLGYDVVKEYVMPQLENVLERLDIGKVVVAQEKKEVKRKVEGNSVNASNNNNNAHNNNNNNNNMSCSYDNRLLTFTLPITAGIDPLLYSSLFASGNSQHLSGSSGTQLQQGGVSSNNNNNETEMILDMNAINKVYEIVNNKATIVYYALIESMMILLHNCSNDKNGKCIKEKIFELCGDNFISNLPYDNNNNTELKISI